VVVGPVMYLQPDGVTQASTPGSGYSSRHPWSCLTR